MTNTTTQFTNLSGMELLDEIIKGFKNTVTLVKELENTTDNVSDKEVEEAVAAFQMMLLQLTIKKVAELTDELSSRPEAPVLKTILAQRAVAEVTEFEYLAVGMLLTGVISLGDLI